MQLISTLLLAQLGCSSPDTHTQLDQRYSEAPRWGWPSETPPATSRQERTETCWANEESLFDDSVMSALRTCEVCRSSGLQKGEAY